MRGIKGGVWKNTEDEILKVAIMKYGLNQWARISSLLTRKSPAQCKARWYEWLDPNIKKTEWSKEEEEKLLHLAKIFPSQWKTIAPLVGRTAAQCLERYNRLLDEVQRQQDGESGSTQQEGGQDNLRRRMGDIDPTPETKPAKPDPIDMDEDEKETLSEAKARLSNTQGKKEKRKFREKQLEEARRLAFLQKKRELKAAGINYNPKKKGKETSWDLKKEIPFYLKPKAGFYDVPDEELRDDPNKDNEFIGKRIDQIENKKYLERQDKINKLEDIKKKKKELFDLPKAIADVSKLNDVEHTTKRSKMVLPQPQLTDDDIQEIADYEKMNGNSEGLLNDGFPVPAPRAPANSTIARTPVRQDTVMMEAKNLLDLSNAQTPLKVDASATPKPKHPTTTTTTTTTSATPLRTPNPLLTQTPNRKYLDTDSSSTSSFEDKFKKQQNKNQLLASLKNLPSPSIEYKLELPSEAPTIEEDQQIELDNSEIHIREEQQLKHKEQFKLRNRSTVLKRNLPRSRNLFKVNDQQQVIQIDDALPLDNQIVKIIQKEINRIISHDNIIFPNDSHTPSLESEDKDYEYFTTNELHNADKLINDEIEQIKLEQDNQQLNIEQVLDRIDQLKSEIIYLSKENKFIEKNLISNDQVIQNIQFDFDKTLNKIKNLSSKSVNLEKKLNIYNGGYQKRSNDIIKDIGSLYDQLEHAEIELQCYKSLKNNETIQMEKRLKTIENEVYDQCETEARLQQKYSRLLNEKNTLYKSLNK